MTNIDWQLAEDEILGAGMVMKLIDGKWCMLREGSDTIYYDAPTKEALISAYFHDDLEDFEELPEKIWPITLINIHLPKEVVTCNRSYCLRQLSDTQWQTAYYNEQQDSFYYSHYHSTYVDASEAFRTELNRNMNHYEHLIQLFYKHRDYIMSQEALAAAEE